LLPLFPASFAMAQVPFRGDDGYRPASVSQLGQQQTSEIQDFDTTPAMALSPPLTNNDDPLPQQPSKDNCDRRRPEEQDPSRLVKMPSALIGKAVSPYLKQHIPDNYAPVGKKPLPENDVTDVRTKDPNTKFCYRHRPDAKCRRAADETKMGFIQR
jgi:hypothetical protein